MKRLVYVMMIVAVIATAAFGVRIKSGDTSRKICFTAYAVTDPNNVTPVTSLSDVNVSYSVDGAAFANIASPTTAALSATDMPGAFSLSVNDACMVVLPAGINEAELYIYVKTSNANPIAMNIDLYRNDSLVAEDVNAQAQNALANYLVPKATDINNVLASYGVPKASHIVADINAAGGASIDWSKIHNPTATVHLDNTTFRKTADPCYMNPEGSAYNRIAETVSTVPEDANF